MLEPKTTWLSFERYLLCAAQAPLDAAQFEHVGQHEATRAIALALADAGLRRLLMRLWGDAHPPSAVAGAGRTDVLAAGWVAAMLVRPGAPLALLRRRLPGITGELRLVGAPPVPAPRETRLDEAVWLELEVLYDDGSGATGSRYRIEGPGDPILGRLDRHGYAFHKPVDPGSYRAIFEGPPEEPPLEKGWVDVEVTDSTGAPMAGAVYQLELSNGQTREGVLDQNGRALIAGIPEGEHRITFPKVDASSIPTGG